MLRNTSWLTAWRISSVTSTATSWRWINSKSSSSTTSIRISGRQSRTQIAWKDMTLHTLRSRKTTLESCPRSTRQSQFQISARSIVKELNQHRFKRAPWRPVLRISRDIHRLKRTRKFAGPPSVSLKSWPEKINSQFQKECLRWLALVTNRIEKYSKIASSSISTVKSSRWSTLWRALPVWVSGRKAAPSRCAAERGLARVASRRQRTS